MSEPYYSDDLVELWHGDCIDVMAELPDASVDAIVTDPPYGLEFMGKDWDRFAGAVSDRDFKGFVLSQQRTRNVKCPDCGKWAYDHPGRLCECGGIRRAQGSAFQQWCEQWATECLRVLKPGGHMLAFGGTRTWHRLAVAVEDAGFEIRDSIAWLYGSGFPKSLDVSKAIDKAAGAERTEVVGRYQPPGMARPWNLTNAVDERSVEVFASSRNNLDVTAPATPEAAAPATPEAAQWQGWGTALKPAFEPIVVARKPLTGTVAANVLAHGTGALNIDGCRLSALTPEEVARSGKSTNGGVYGEYRSVDWKTEGAPHPGRWPANVVLDPDAAAELDEQSGELVSGTRKAGNYAGLGYMGSESADFPAVEGNSGGASRFFYTSKADSGERITHNGVAHPTVKPLSLMRWLVRLVTPPGGLILEPFAGSGTTVEAALLEGFRCIAIEREADYLPLITQRIHRRRDPVEYLTAAGEDLGLFGEAS